MPLLRMIAPGVLLLLLAAAGLIYVLARPKPPLEDLEPVQLRLEKEVPAPTIEPIVETEKPPPVKSRVTRIVTQQPPPIKTFAVKILSPRMAETFTAPAKVTLKASANRERELTGIEFYKSPDETVCQSLTNPKPFPAELKIGETRTTPYEFVWNIPEPGVFTIVAVASYEGGEKQISAPVVIVVDSAQPYDGPEWRGWEPAYPDDQLLQQDSSLMAAPTPTPNPESCPKVVVSSVPVSPNGNTVSFQAIVSGPELPADLTFNWNVSAGEIVSGQYTSTINVALDRILDTQIVASVEIGHLPAICSTFGSASVRFEQPRWISKEFRNLLEQLKLKLRVNNDYVLRRYIEIYSERNDCVDEELLKEATLLKRYFVEYRGLKSENVVIVNAGYDKDKGDSVDLRLFFADQSPSEVIEENLRRPLVPCRSSSSVSAQNYGTPVNRSCPDLDETVQYQTSFSLGSFRINTCPYNPRDPINSETQTKLLSSVGQGVYSNYPSFRFWANAGKVLSNRPEGIWDLSQVKLRPGRYVAIAKADDGCDCTNINTATIPVENFCTPCLTMTRICSSSPEHQGLQFYSADARKFAVAEKTTFHWTTTKGTIIKGQGSLDIVIDTRGLPNGEKFLVTVAVGGLMRYCVNTVSQPAVVEEFPCGARKFDEYGNIRFPGRRARRRPQPEEITETTGNEKSPSPPDEEPPVHHGPPRTNEKEWMKISWTPRVKIDDAVIVRVVYNRTTESFQVLDTAGEISEELKLGKLLKEWFGENYQTFGDVHLRTAGLKCDSCNQEQYQSFDKEKLEWSWPLKPESTGMQSFNLELWVKGEPRDKSSNQPSMPAEKVWSRLDNKVNVTEPFMTRNTVYAGGGLCAVLGLGLCVRGLKIYRIGDTYNVGQAVAVGRNVTMTNTTVNQQAANNNVKNGEDGHA